MHLLEPGQQGIWARWLLQHSVALYTLMYLAVTKKYFTELGIQSLTYLDLVYDHGLVGKVDNWLWHRQSERPKPGSISTPSLQSDMHTML